MVSDKIKIRFLENSLLINNEIFVLGDIHIGFEEHISTSGLLRIQMKDIFNDLKDIFKKLEKENIKLKKIIILGDLKHEFGGISESEWRDVLKFLDYLGKKTKEIILIKGNHDNIIGPIAKKRKVKLKNYYKYKDICFIHGNKEYKGCLDSKILIMGHLHPSVTLSDNYKKERYKCFLKGKWKKKEVYILPSFSSISFGYDISEMCDKDKKGFLIIPHKKIKNFKVIIYNKKEDKEYNFGKLGKIKN